MLRPTNPTGRTYRLGPNTLNDLSTNNVTILVTLNLTVKSVCCLIYSVESDNFQSMRTETHHKNVTKRKLKMSTTARYLEAV